MVATATRDDNLYAKLRTIPGGRWEKSAQAMSYPASASAALMDLVDRGILDDPERLLQPAEVTVSFDVRTARFQVRGDSRAAAAFDKHFPARDVVAVWKERGLDVAFVDSFAEEMYRGELARDHGDLQPEGFKVDLYPYQRNDVAVMVERSGIPVLHGMGCGKTPLGIAAAYELMYNRNAVPRTVVVVPPAVRSQWKREILRFTGVPEEQVVVVDGKTKADRMVAYEQARETDEDGEPIVKWLIVHYQAVILPDDRKHLKALTAGCLLIADEAHKVKDYTTKTSKVMGEYARAASRRIALTGTPVENNPGEWFSVFSGFAIPGLFGSPVDFLNRYSWPGQWGGYEGAREVPELRARSKPFYIRRTLEEVAEHLPPMRVQTIHLDLKPDYAAVLRRAHNEARDAIAEKRLADHSARNPSAGVLDGAERDEIEAGAEMTAASMLKLLCCSPRIIAESSSPAAEVLREKGVIPDDDGPKLDELRNMAAEMAASGERLVVFTASKRMANLVAQRLEEDQIRHVLYTGDTSSADRDLAVAAFTTPSTPDNPGPTVFVATDAAAEGLNLGRCCSTLVNLDIPWTPGRLGQRNARIRRVDSNATGFLVVNLVLRGTIEEGILKMVERKSDLGDALFGETTGRSRTTGRRGANVFEQALVEWADAA